MEKLEKLYEGKAKILYKTSDPDLLIQYFKDDASAFDGKKKGTIVDKGVMNNHMSSRIFEYLEENGVKTHFVKNLNDREMLVKNLDIIFSFFRVGVGIGVFFCKFFLICKTIN